MLMIINWLSEPQWPQTIALLFIMASVIQIGYLVLLVVRECIGMSGVHWRVILAFTLFAFCGVVIVRHPETLAVLICFVAAICALAAWAERDRIQHELMRWRSRKA